MQIKNKLRLKKQVVLLMVLFSFFLPAIHTYAESLSASQVVDKVNSRNDGDTMISNMTMILIDQNKKQRIRRLKGYSKDYGKDSKNIVFFISPADVRNTAYLTYNWDEQKKDTDSWLYLPALRKVKRINSDDTSGAFMGSDFSYADVNGLNYSDWKYKFVNKSVKIGGHDAWEIIGKPKKGIKEKVVKETGYVKVKFWVRKDIFMVVKGKYWVRKGRKIKYFKADDIKKINGVYTAHKLNMITTQRGKEIHASIIQYGNVMYNKVIKDNMFTLQKMERGI